MKLVIAAAFCCGIFGVYSFIVFGGKSSEVVAAECQHEDKYEQLGCVCKNYRTLELSDPMIELCATVNWVGPEAAIELLKHE